MATEMILSLVGDYGGLRPDGVPLVESDGDYVAVCSAIRAGSVDEVWVRRRVHLAWLEAFLEMMGLECVLKEKTPRVLLAEAVGCPLPHWLTDKQILDEGLLEGEISKGTTGRFVSETLAREISPVFLEPELTAGALSTVLSALQKEETHKRLLSRPSLRRCLEDQCGFWAAKGKSAWVGFVCERLPQSSVELHRDITFQALLAKYPVSLKEFKLSAQSRLALKDLDPAPFLKGLKHSGALSETEELLRTEMTRVVGEIGNAPDFRKLLNCFSGFLQVEFEMTLAVLDAGKVPVDLDLIQEIKDCFEDGGVVPGAKLESLSLRVPPPLPEIKPEGFEAWSQWEDWAIRQYLPYRAWQQATGCVHPELESMVERFSGWVLEQYPALHADPDISLIHALKGLERSFREETLTLLLVVDCLSEFFREDLQSAFREKGFHLDQARHACAPLPSCTEISKPLLLSGTHEVKGADYESILKKRAAARWPGKQVRYFGGNLGALRKWEGGDGGNFLVLNDLTVDELMHEDVEAKGATHAEEVRRHFARLANAVRELVDNWSGDPAKVGIHVVTDHGATRILDAETESVDSTLTAKLFPNEKYRFAGMTLEEAEALPKSLWSLGYAFQPPFVEEKRKWFIPKGHHTVRKAKPGGYVHGGATPEELLVPVLSFRAVNVAWKPVECRAVGLRLNAEGEALFYLRRLQPIHLEVRNPNGVAVTVTRVDVLSAGVEIRQSALTSIPPLGKSEVRMELMFTDAAVGESDLVLQLGWNIQGEKEGRELRIPARIQSAMGGGFSLKDL